MCIHPTASKACPSLKSVEGPNKETYKSPTYSDHIGF